MVARRCSRTHNLSESGLVYSFPLRVCRVDAQSLLERGLPVHGSGNDDPRRVRNRFLACEFCGTRLHSRTPSWHRVTLPNLPPQLGKFPVTRDGIEKRSLMAATDSTSILPWSTENGLPILVNFPVAACLRGA